MTKPTYPEGARKIAKDFEAKYAGPVAYTQSQMRDDIFRLTKSLADIADLLDDSLDVGEQFDDIMNRMWGLLYPNDPNSWDYPGQVLNHIRVELDRQRKAAEVAWSYFKYSGSGVPALSPADYAKIREKLRIVLFSK